MFTGQQSSALGHRDKFFQQKTTHKFAHTVYSIFIAYLHKTIEVFGKLLASYLFINEVEPVEFGQSFEESDDDLLNVELFKGFRRNSLATLKEYQEGLHYGFLLRIQHILIRLKVFSLSKDMKYCCEIFDFPEFEGSIWCIMNDMLMLVALFDEKFNGSFDKVLKLVFFVDKPLALCKINLYKL